ncbi:crotonobetainyl-CoA:carnitine CoA-transferase CaiB-like acyl-CoA transferase [Amorphus suaedae]
MTVTGADDRGGEPAGGPLAGIRVLDFGQFIAGPLCVALLGDLGADVVRIERPQGSADRTVQPLAADLPGGAVYLHVNRNKRSLALDPFDPASRPALDALIAGADVVVANLPPPTRAAMGLDFERLNALNPRLVLVTCSAFGTGTGLADLPGFDGIGQAVSGAMHMSGEDGNPRKSYVHFVDHMTAAMSAFSTLAALRERDRTGEGAHVETSLAGNALFMMAGNLIEESHLALGREGTGNRAQLAAPANTYATLDGHILVQVIGNGMFRRSARLLGREAWIDDPRYGSDEARGDAYPELDAAMAAWCAAHTTAACVDLLRAALIPVAPVLSPREALESADIAGECVWGAHDCANLRDSARLSLQQPVTYSGRPVQVRSAAPQLGAHSIAVLEEAGLDRGTIDRLLSDGLLFDGSAEAG